MKLSSRVTWKRALGAIAFLILVDATLCLGQEFTSDNSSTSVQTEPVQWADAPLIFELTITNKSRQIIRYWNGGPGMYPNAKFIPASMTNLQSKKSVPVCLENWQYEVGSGRMREIRPGESVNLPAAMPPLPPGKYSFSINGSAPVEISLEQGLAVEEAYENLVVAHLSQREPFFQRLASHYGNVRVDQVLIKNLLSDDVKVALTSAEALNSYEKMPAKTDVIFNQALNKNIAVAQKNPNDSYDRRELLAYLGMALAKCKTDFALKSVISLSHSTAIDKYADLSGQGNQLRRIAILDLGQFPQPSALDELRGFLKDPDQMVQDAAIECLAAKKDPMALALLITIAQTPKRSYRSVSLNLLANFYPQDKRVRPILEKAATDPDHSIRFMAKDALKTLDRLNP
jgi:HEAT repeat protein